MPSYQLPQAVAPAPPAAPRPMLMSVGVAPLAATAPATDPVDIYALPIERNLHIYKGDDFYLDLVVTNPDGTDADLSGATPSAQIRTTPNSPDLLASFDATVDGNTIHLHLPHEQSVNLAGQFAWDAQITNPLSARQTQSSTWAWSTDHTGAYNPGQIGLNQPMWDADDLFVNFTDANGDDQTTMLAQVQAGDIIRVELISDRTRFAEYVVSASPVIVDQFYEFPLTAPADSGGDPPSAGEPTKLTVPTLVIEFNVNTLVAGSVSVSGEVTMP